MDAMTVNLRIRELTKGGVVRPTDIPELQELAKKVYHQSAMEDLILPLMACLMPKKTPKEALEMLVREIGAYRGAAIESAVYGVVGAAAALEAIGAISQDEACDWRGKAKQAGALQAEKTGLTNPK